MSEGILVSEFTVASVAETNLNELTTKCLKYIFSLSSTATNKLNISFPPLFAETAVVTGYTRKHLSDSTARGKCLHVNAIKKVKLQSLYCLPRILLHDCTNKSFPEVPLDRKSLRLPSSVCTSRVTQLPSSDASF